MVHNPDFLDSGIRDRTEVCKNKFRACSAHPKLKKQEWLETGQAEFNVWSLGLNASESGRSSLDYKVRRRTELREDITDLLDGLAECLSECLDLAEIAPSSYRGQNLLEKIGDKPTLSPQDDPDSPLYFNIFTIKQILRILWVQESEIREFGPRFRYHKAAASLKSVLNKNINSLKYYTTKAAVAGLQNSKPKGGFPKRSKNANKQPLDRLVNQNTRRKNRISFATNMTRKTRSRQLKDEERSAMVVGLVQGPDATEEAVQLERKPQGPPTIRDSSKRIPTSHPLLQEGRLNEESQTPAAITIPSSAVINQVSFKAAEATITRATGTVHDNICLLSPKWPEKLEFQHINYPYCSGPLSRKYLLQWAWKGYVLDDNLPYNCFFEDCKTPNDLYRTSEELTKHIVSEHAVPCWVCDTCTPDIGLGHGPFEIFASAQLLREHLRHSHWLDILDILFPLVAERTMRKVVSLL